MVKLNKRHFKNSSLTIANVLMVVFAREKSAIVFCDNWRVSISFFCNSN